MKPTWHGDPDNDRTIIGDANSYPLKDVIWKLTEAGFEDFYLEDPEEYKPGKFITTYLEARFSGSDELNLEDAVALANICAWYGPDSVSIKPGTHNIIVMNWD